MSLFITGLAFDRADLQADAKLGTLSASIVAALLGSLILSRNRRSNRQLESRTAFILSMRWMPSIDAHRSGA